ncbi:MAG: glycosyltransferase [Chloroflexi bacterium]|nr:glycosyltransferase [Chloroflexota bacterium]
MNLLIVSRGVRPISSDLAGGAEFVLLNHARSLARLGHSVHMVSDSEGLAPEDNPYMLHQVGTPLWFGNFCRRAGFSLWIILHLLGNMLAAWSALRVIRNSREPFDVIHCHGNLSGLLISIFHHSTPIVYTEHDSTPWTCYYPSLAERILRKTVYNLFNVRLYRRAITIAVLYPEQKAELERRWGISPEKVVVVANGVNEHLFSPYLEYSPHPGLPPEGEGIILSPFGGELERGHRFAQNQVSIGKKFMSARPTISAPGQALRAPSQGRS